jgi:hypothetical protein
MTNDSQQLDILDKLYALMEADTTLSGEFEGWYDYIPDDIPGATQFPCLCIDWTGDEHASQAIGGYRHVTSSFVIMVLTDEPDKRDARRELVELCGQVTDFLSKTSTMAQSGYWSNGRLAHGGGQNVRVGRSDYSEGSTGYVYSALIYWQAEYRKARVT